ncbi:hypothetical protein DFH06DRAFT_1322821 [Mycena polygramma]|nr:hypothetical protein DFH06DRAFT_1336899 [Mycena polygramma]KAJ7666850.1 hypothetical protein DFH06DRAFT_1322821 [Mycena polygramma]
MTTIAANFLAMNERGARDPERTSLATDLSIFYALTRDRTMADIDGVVERFSYKDVHFADQAHDPNIATYKACHRRYRGILVGQIHSKRIEYDDNPLLLEGHGRSCTVVLLKCPEGADKDTVHLFALQVLGLKRIVDADMIKSPGQTDVQWVVPDSTDGSPMIEVTTCYPIGETLEFGVGRDVEMCVYIVKDERVLNQVAHKTFTLWARDYTWVDSEAVGRH